MIFPFHSNLYAYSQNAESQRGFHVKKITGAGGPSSGDEIIDGETSPPKTRIHDVCNNHGGRAKEVAKRIRSRGAGSGRGRGSVGSRQCVILQ